jgi:hypothetical protein
MGTIVHPSLSKKLKSHTSMSLKNYVTKNYSAAGCTVTPPARLQWCGAGIFSMPLHVTTAWHQNGAPPTG